MQTARKYVENAAYRMGNAIDQIQPTPVRQEKPQPVTAMEIRQSVEQLLTPDEQFICDHATD